jgi:hypothetical protein
MLVPLFAAIGAGCGNGPTEVESISDLAGTWTATRVIFTVIADPQQHADLIALGGGTVLVIEADGSCRWEQTFPGDDPPQVDRATVSLSGGNLVFEFLDGEGGTLTLAFTLSGNVLTLVGDVKLERGDYGLTSDEFAILARMEMDLRRD